MTKKPTVIVRKKYKINVLRMKVGELNPGRCSAKFREHGLGPDDEVYVKCDVAGNIEYRGKRMRYSIFDIESHKEVLL